MLQNRYRRKTTEDEEEVKKPEDTGVRKTAGVAERLRMKNQELLSSIDRSSDRTTERNSYSRDQNSTGSVASITSTTRDRGLDKTNKISSSSDASDTKEIQRKLEQTEKELQEYKDKYEKLRKEKEDLENKLNQYQEDLEKMQELKNDNVRLKDENGALIRVISKLSRTPASSS